MRDRPLYGLLPPPTSALPPPPNISRWGSHGQSPDRSNVRRGRRGKAEKAIPQLGLMCRAHAVRNWKRHQTSRYLVGNLVDRSDMDGRLACESIAESLCVLLWRGAGDSEHRAVTCVACVVAQRRRGVCAARAHWANGEHSWRVLNGQGCARGCAGKHRAPSIAASGRDASALPWFGVCA